MAPKRKWDEAENPDESFVVAHTPNLKRKRDEVANPDESFVVAHTPNLTCRHKSLLANITSLLPAYQKKKKSYKCPSGQRNKILKWSKCTTCLFLEYDENDQNLFLWMIKPIQKLSIKFHVNAVSETDILDMKASFPTTPALAFSSNFDDGEKWICAKNMLGQVFGSSYQEGAQRPDYLYVFSRCENYIHFRSFKIHDIPDCSRTNGVEADGDDVLSLTEVGSSIVLKLMDIFEGSSSSKVYLDDTIVKTQTVLKYELSLVDLPMLANANSGCLAHNVMIEDKHYCVLLGCISDVSMFDGFYINLKEFLEREPSLKLKKIPGSSDDSSHDKEFCFLRNKMKKIIRSLMHCVNDLHLRGYCMGEFGMNNFLLKGSEVQVHNVKLMPFEEKWAIQNILRLIDVIRGCFGGENTPPDLNEALVYLSLDPIRNINVLKNHCSLMLSAKKNHMLVDMYMEYMTNIRGNKRRKGGGLISFISECPIHIRMETDDKRKPFSRFYHERSK